MENEHVQISKELLIPARLALFQNKGEEAVPVTFWPKYNSLEVQTSFLMTHTV